MGYIAGTHSTTYLPMLIYYTSSFSPTPSYLLQHGPKWLYTGKLLVLCQSHLLQKLPFFAILLATALRHFTTELKLGLHGTLFQ